MSARIERSIVNHRRHITLFEEFIKNILAQYNISKRQKTMNCGSRAIESKEHEDYKEASEDLAESINESIMHMQSAIIDLKYLIKKSYDVLDEIDKLIKTMQFPPEASMFELHLIKIHLRDMLIDIDEPQYRINTWNSVPQNYKGIILSYLKQIYNIHDRAILFLDSLPL